MKRFVIIGLGNFGSTVAEALYARGHEVIAVDLREEVVDGISAHASRAVVADGRQVEVLERIGVKSSDTAVISMGDDIASSLLVTLPLRDLGVDTIYEDYLTQPCPCDAACGSERNDFSRTRVGAQPGPPAF